MVADVELAMGIVQLTGVLIPLLLGLARYYVDNQDNEQLDAIPDRFVNGYIMMLFGMLFVAYTSAMFPFFEYGNGYLIAAVIAYGAFLLLLFTLIPYILERFWTMKLFLALSGLLVILTVFIFVSLYLMNLRQFLFL